EGRGGFGLQGQRRRAGGGLDLQGRHGRRDGQAPGDARGLGHVADERTAAGEGAVVRVAGPVELGRVGRGGAAAGRRGEGGRRGRERRRRRGAGYSSLVKET